MPHREEAAGIIAAQHSRKESGALAAYEEQLNEVWGWRGMEAGITCLLAPNWPAAKNSMKVMGICESFNLHIATRFECSVL